MTLPLTVIGGYLGAGKTTLINRILAQNPSERLAILVNDFGSINVDEHLIAEHAGPTMRLTNGCVCCALADDLGAALKQLMPLDLDHVLLEASGAALPSKLAAIGNTWPGYRHHKTIVLADASRLREQLKDPYIGALVRNQLTYADLRVATKLDLCLSPEHTLNEIENQFGPTTTIPATGVDLRQLLSLAPERTAQLTPDFIQEVPHAFQSANFEHDGPLAHDSVEAVLRAAARGLERAKGWIETDRGRFLVQISGARFEFTQAQQTSTTGTSIVLISTDATAALTAAKLKDLADSARI